VTSEIFPHTAFIGPSRSPTLSFTGMDGSSKLLLFQASLAPLGMYTFQIEPVDTSNGKIEYLSSISQLGGVEADWLEHSSSSEV
jgi:hypothetical protein